MALRCVGGIDALAAVEVVESRMVPGDRRLMPRRWRAVIVLCSVWHHPDRVLDPMAREQLPGCQTSCLYASSAVEAHHGHDYKAEEVQAGIDRSGWLQHWTTNFVKLHFLCGDADSIPPHASPCRCPDS